MLTIINSPAANQLPDQAEYVLAPEVILVMVQDGTARLVDLQGQIYALSHVAAAMLQLSLTQGTRHAGLEIAARFHAHEQQVQADLTAFLNQLAGQGLIQTRKQCLARRPKASLASRLLLPALKFMQRCLPSLKSRAMAMLGLARMSCRWLGWTRTVALFQEFVGQCQIRQRPEEARDLVKEIDEVVREAAAQHLLQVACKERGLTCWALARATGIPTTLVIGLSLIPLEGHCWCEAGPFTLSDDQNRCDRYTPIVRYV